MNEYQTQTILVGHRVTVPSPHPSPLRQLTSVNPSRRRRQQQQSHDPTLRVRWNLTRYTTQPSRSKVSLGAKNSQLQNFGRASGNLHCTVYPSLSGGQAFSAKGNVSFWNK
jgi:hypothetical protein